MKQQVIMVEIADREWTLEALQRACKLARRTGAQIALVHMVSVTHCGWLGSGWSWHSLTMQQWKNLDDYVDTIEDHHVDYTIVPFQFVTKSGAAVEAAEQVGADVVFVRPPAGGFALWTQFQQRRMRRQFENLGCQWMCSPADDMAAEGALDITPVMQGVAKQARA